jgi:creatinine amidohydrolase
MRVADCNWMQLESYLEQDDRIVLPLGSTEQHAYLSLATDTTLAERVAVEAAEPLGVPVLPALAYGLTPSFVTFPGTVTLREETYAAVVKELVASVREQGFRRVLIVNGHGGNGAVREAVVGGGVLWRDWFAGPRVSAAVEGVGVAGGHASWTESFPWTRLAGVTLPNRPKKPVTVPRELGAEAVRALVGDGSFGGPYALDDETMASIGQAAVDDVREVLETWPRPDLSHSSK